MRNYLFLLTLMTGFCVHGSECYVAVNSASPAPPYTNWQTAARDIQTAVDIASPFDVIIVSNGTYLTGGRVEAGGITNRLVIPSNITVRSANGPAVTTIRGSGPIGSKAVRCVFLRPGATVDGFTLENGYTLNYGDFSLDQSGGATWCENSGGIVLNCTIRSCTSACYGGGGFGGTYRNCTIANNYALYWGGGVILGELHNCIVISNTAGSGGGGMDHSTAFDTIIQKNAVGNLAGGANVSSLYRCTVQQNNAKYGGGAAQGISHETLFRNNYASQGGGGVWNGTHYNAQMIGNSALIGGAAYGGSLQNCTVVYNSGGHAGGGIADGGAMNSIVMFNTAGSGPNWDNSGMSFCCTIPGQAGESSITNDPHLVPNDNGIYLIDGSSPCINAGTNQSWMYETRDFEGQPRLINEVVDVGADEAGTDLVMWMTSNTLIALLRSPPGTTSIVQHSASMNDGSWINTGLIVTGPAAQVTLETGGNPISHFYRTLKQ